MVLGIGLQLLVLASLITMIVAMWKLFEKAGQPGWAAIVPFFNFYTALKVVGRPGWWLALMFVPIANVVVAILVAVDLAKAFGRDGGFAVLLILLPFVGFPMLAFSADSVYRGPVADPMYQQAMWAQQGYPPPGYPMPGYQQPYAMPGYPQPGYALQPGYPQQAYPQQPGYPPPGYPQQPGYPPQQHYPQMPPQQPGYPPRY
jgi:hypothetical protein